MANEIQKFDAASEITAVKQEFERVAMDGVKFAQELLFATQMIEGSSYLHDACKINKNSLRNAILNIATVGLSLNPALKLAYLVPRKGRVCLDISYMGLVKLATDSQSIRWCQSEVVRKNDVFIYKGLGSMPIHEMNPFGDRGEIVGVYCVARTSDGDFLPSVMTKAECDAIRDRAMSKSGPWSTDYEEMAKKTVIKRASKLWPKSERLMAAVDMLNEHEGIDFEVEKQSEKLPAPEPFNYDEHNKLVQRVGEYVFEMTQQMDNVKKAEFLSSIGVKSSADLKKKTKEQLELILSSVPKLPAKQLTVEDVPF